MPKSLFKATAPSIGTQVKVKAYDELKESGGTETKGTGTGPVPSNPRKVRS